jgi:hypothetical protein
VRASGWPPSREIDRGVQITRSVTVEREGEAKPVLVRKVDYAAARIGRAPE